MNPIVSIGNKIRWKFDDVEDLKTREGDDSDEYCFDGVTWKINACTDTVNDVKFLELYLLYDSDNQNDKNWICEVDAKYKLLNQSGNGKHLVKESEDLYYHEFDCGIPEFITWDELISKGNGYLKDDSIVIEIEFNFKYYDFSKKVPNYTDITINLEETDFYVNKWVLCSKSEYFYDMFVNKKIEDTVIKDDIEAIDFCYFLASFDPFFNNVTDYNYEDVMRGAKKYGVSFLHYKCEQFLISDAEIELIDKVKYAEEYGYETLMKSCIESLKTGADIRILHANVKFSKLKETTKLRIMQRFLEVY